MSREASELSAIENLCEENIATYKELMNIEDDRDLTDHDLELMWKAAENEYYGNHD